ncbi:MAG: hypothetical protein WCJ30_09770, partial [Deltaproteobacteria bacterium]
AVTNLNIGDRVAWMGRNGLANQTVAPAAAPVKISDSMPFDKVLELAFRNHYIDALDHPVIKALRGEE